MPKFGNGRVRTTNESMSELDQFLARMTALGATDDEVAAVREGWDTFDEHWTPEYRHRFVRLGDGELLADLRAVRDEYDVGTTTEDEAEARDNAARESAAFLEASGRMGQSVPALLDWVGDDEARAFAVHRLESSAEGAGRSTLIGPLEAKAGAWAAANG